MKKNLFRIALFSTVITALSLGSCSNDDNNDSGNNSGEDDGTRWITLTGSFPDAGGTAGNGGTRAYAITPENAANPNYEVDLFKMEGEKYVNGFALKSSRTARVQASEDGKFLYNIQYTGTEGGVFNKYKVNGEGKYEEVGFELNTATILGTSPRWVKAAEGIGVGVSFGEALDPYTGTAPNYVYRHPKGTIKIANIDLNSTAITNTGSISINLGTELEAKGYHVWRADVPVLNQDKTKLYIGLGIRRHNINGTVTTNATSGAISGWQLSTDARDLGTVTYVVDYPKLINAKIIISNNSKIDNLGYRTLTQYVGTDGNLYQATATSGPDILRISKATGEYDQNYHFNLNTALGITGAQIKAWRYIKDGLAVVLYTASTPGAYVALVNLNDKSATKLATDIEADTALASTFGQFQNIGLVGDNVYLPLTPSGKDGNIYIIDTKTKEIKKGAKLKTATGSFFLGAY